MVRPLIDVSVVPVASKNTKRGEIPDIRTVLTFNVSGPLVTPERAQGTALDEDVGGVDLELSRLSTLLELEAAGAAELPLAGENTTGVSESSVSAEGWHAHNAKANSQSSSQ